MPARLTDRRIAREVDPPRRDRWAEVPAYLRGARSTLYRDVAFEESNNLLAFPTLVGARLFDQSTRKAMFQRALVAIAGVDRDTLKTCPATDKLWAAHLGFALVPVVHRGARHFVPRHRLHDCRSVDARSRLARDRADRVHVRSRALPVGLVLSGVSLAVRAPDGGASGGRSPRRFLRIAIRLAMSFGLAWVIAVFLELAIFSDTIGDKIKRDHVTVNQPVFQKIEQYQAELSAEIEQRRKNLAALETLYRDELPRPPFPRRPSPRSSANSSSRSRGSMLRRTSFVPSCGRSRSRSRPTRRT